MDRNALREELAVLLEKTVGERPPELKDEDNLRESLKLDSLDLVSLVIEIQARFNIEVPTAELNGIATVGNLLDYLTAKLAAKEQAQAA